MSGGARVPIALVVAVAAISFAAIFFREAQPTPPLAAAGIRLAVAAVLLSPFAVRAIRSGHLRGRRLRLACWAGLAYGVHFGAWVASLELTSVAASVTVVTASPLLLAIIGVVTGRDAPTPRLWLALAVGAVGLGIVGAQDLNLSADALVGDGLALLGAAGMAVYLLLGRAAGDDLDAVAFSGVAVATGAASLAVACVVTGTPFEPADASALGFLVLAALLPQLVGHTLLTWSLRHARPTTVGIATLGEPVGASLLAWLWLGEGMLPWVAVGCGVTLCAVALALRADREHVRRQ